MIHTVDLQTGFSGVDCSQEPRQLYNESWGVVFALTLVGICTIFIYLINLRPGRRFVYAIL